VKTAVENATSKLGIPLSQISPFYRLSGDPLHLSPIDFLHNEHLGLVKKEIINILKILSETQKILFVKNLIALPIPKHCTKIHQNSLAEENLSKLTGKEWGGIFWNAGQALSLILDANSKHLSSIIMHSKYYRLLIQDVISENDVMLCNNMIQKHHEEFAALYPQNFSHKKNCLHTKQQC
jgi:hypothetical protein